MGTTFCRKGHVTIRKRWMHRRGRRFLVTTEKNPSPVCPTVYEDDDVKHVVLQQAKKTHLPICSFAEALRASSRDALMALARSSSSSGTVALSRSVRKASPPAPPDQDRADWDPEGKRPLAPSAEEVENAWWEGCRGTSTTSSPNISFSH